MWVKICANTNLNDARFAAEMGADAVGFVFAPSKRQVTAEQVRAISFGLPEAVERVGVFGAGSAESIAEAAAYARLNAVQLHGAYDAGLSRRLAALLGPGVSLIQTVHWSLDREDAGEQVATALATLGEEAPARRALLDAKVGSSSGGLGLSFDWKAAGAVITRRRDQQVVLAGGLRPETVAEAIRLSKPWGVDVASGVESAPGTKDQQKVRQFIQNARGA